MATEAEIQDLADLLALPVEDVEANYDLAKRLSSYSYEKINSPEFKEDFFSLMGLMEP